MICSACFATASEDEDSGNSTDTYGDSDADTDLDTNGDGDIGEGACEAAAETLELHIETGGGKDGKGVGTIDIADGAITITLSFGGSCSQLLGAAQMDSISAAACEVPWNSLKEDYSNPENKECCCDQIIYDLRATVPPCDIAVHWCSDSMMEIDGAALLPKSVDTLFDVVTAAAEELWHTCAALR
jgi:hypothetical protein